MAQEGEDVVVQVEGLSVSVSTPQTETEAANVVTSSLHPVLDPSEITPNPDRMDLVHLTSLIIESAHRSLDSESDPSSSSSSSSGSSSSSSPPAASGQEGSAVAGVQAEEAQGGRKLMVIGDIDPSIAELKPRDVSLGSERSSSGGQVRFLPLLPFPSLSFPLLPFPWLG